MATLDKEGKEIQVGNLVKKYGPVQYADGVREKYSKKTWVISHVDEDGVYWTDEHGNPVPLTCKEGFSLVVVGHVDTGYSEEYAQIQDDAVVVRAGSVGQKYRVLKDVDSQGWKAGDLVMIHGTVGKETLERGVLERYDGDEEHKHVIVVADPVKVRNAVNKTQ